MLRLPRDVIGIDCVVLGTDFPYLRRDIALRCHEDIEASPERAGGCPRRYGARRRRHRVRGSTRRFTGAGAASFKRRTPVVSLRSPALRRR